MSTWGCFKAAASDGWGLSKIPDKVRLVRDPAMLRICEWTGALPLRGNGGSDLLRGTSNSLEALVSSELVNEGVRGGRDAVI